MHLEVIKQTFFLKILQFRLCSVQQASCHPKSAGRAVGSLHATCGRAWPQTVPASHSQNRDNNPAFGDTEPRRGALCAQWSWSCSWGWNGCGLGGSHSGTSLKNTGTAPRILPFILPPPRAHTCTHTHAHAHACHTLLTHTTHAMHITHMHMTCTSHTCHTHYSHTQHTPCTSHTCTRHAHHTCT